MQATGASMETLGTHHRQGAVPSSEKRLRKMRDEAKKQYIHNQLIAASSPRETHSTLNNLLQKNKCRQLPEHDSSTQLANRFAEYFTEKIARIRDHLPAPASVRPAVEETHHDVHPLASLQPVTEELTCPQTDLLLSVQIMCTRPTAYLASKAVPISTKDDLQPHQLVTCRGILSCVPEMAGPLCHPF
jgi:hypothetical protein